MSLYEAMEKQFYQVETCGISGFSKFRFLGREFMLVKKNVKKSIRRKHDHDENNDHLSAFGLTD